MVADDPLPYVATSPFYVKCAKKDPYLAKLEFTRIWIYTSLFLFLGVTLKICH